jgi:hypothetical protein
MKPNRDDDAGGTASYVDPFDRTIGALHGLPDVTSTKTSVTRVVPPFGVGGTQLYVVQTYRQKEQGDTIFLEHVSETGTVRLVIPPQVSAVIARQREQLTAKTRSRAAKAAAQDRKQRGEIPAFLKSKRKAKGEE